MENEGINGWIRDGVYYHPHLFGGVILTAALLGLSTGYFGGIKVPSLRYFGSEIFPKRRRARRRVRVYMDGCFDLMHYGHANALRQAKALGDELVVGVVSDEEIIANKGPPVLSMEERLALVSGLKWVDEVIPNAPYAITEDFMKLLFREYKIDYIIHGDDPCLLPDGSDAYALAKRAGRYKQIKRTEGVSSTDIVGRILSSSNDTLGNGNTNDPCVNGVCQGLPESTHISQFLPTSRRIVQFSNGKDIAIANQPRSGVVPFDFNKFEYRDPLKESPAPNSRVVYIDGAFDLFHAGHVEILKKARELGDFLLVGIYADQTVSEHRGKSHPIMHLHERSLSVLACRYVDEIIIGAPWAITKDMITTFNISLVMHGTIAETPSQPSRCEADPYTVPKSMGIFQLLDSPKDITTSLIAQRIAANHEAYKKRNAKKTESEKKYYAEKNYVADE